jgi:hypothetical protein
MSAIVSTLQSRVVGAGRGPAIFRLKWEIGQAWRFVPDRQRRRLFQPSVVQAEYKTVDGSFAARDRAERGQNPSKTWQTVSSQAKFGTELPAIIRRMPLRFAYYAAADVICFAGGRGDSSRRPARCRSRMRLKIAIALTTTLTSAT